MQETAKGINVSVGGDGCIEWSARVGDGLIESEKNGEKNKYQYECREWGKKKPMLARVAMH